MRTYGTLRICKNVLRRQALVFIRTCRRSAVILSQWSRRACSQWNINKQLISATIQSETEAVVLCSVWAKIEDEKSSGNEAMTKRMERSKTRLGNNGRIKAQLGPIRQAIRSDCWATNVASLRDGLRTAYYVHSCFITAPFFRELHGDATLPPSPSTTKFFAK